MCIVYLLHYLFSLYLTGHHECEILGRGPEAAESGSLWEGCKKNPGHEDFISAKDFKDNYLPRVHIDKHRDILRARIDLTVRLRVMWTSPDRPDDYPFSKSRGKDETRVGTGIIIFVSNVTEKPCPCVKCNGEITRKFWRFTVLTAAHVVYNTEEAKSTKVDLFYDDDSCRLDGRMVTVTGLEVAQVDLFYDDDSCRLDGRMVTVTGLEVAQVDLFYDDDSCRLDGRMVSVTGLEVAQIEPDSDTCNLRCVSHDEALGERLNTLNKCWVDGFRESLDLSGLDLLPSCDGDRHPVLVVSHPHGQPKQITVGQGRDGEHPLIEYNAATCRGSSGAPVFGLYAAGDNRLYVLWFTPVHSGSFTSTSTQHGDQLNLLARLPQELRGQEAKQEQHNYGHWRLS